MNKLIQYVLDYNNDFIANLFRKQVVEVYDKWLLGLEEGSFYNHEYYMVRDKDESKKVINYMLDDIKPYLLKLKKKEVSNSFLYMLGVLYCGGVSLCYDIETSKHYFYTKDKKFLEYIHSLGILESDIDYLLSSLDKSLIKDINNEVFTCVELRFDKDTIKGVVKRNLVIGLKGNLFCYPLKSLIDIGNMLKSKKGYYRVVLKENKKIKTYNVSFQYNGVDTGMISKLSLPIYNPIANCIQCYDLESPLDEVGIVQLNLMGIFKIMNIDEGDINKSLRNLDSLLFRKWLFSKIRRLDLKELQSLQLIGVKDYTNMKSKVEVLIRELSKMSTKDLYYFALANEHVLGNIEKGVDNVRKWAFKVFKNFTEVELPSDRKSKIIELKRLLSESVLKVTYIKKDGKITTHYATNNQKILERVFNKNYVEKLETTGVKVKYLLNLFKENNFSEKEKLELISKYGLSAYDINVNNIDSGLLQIKDHLDKEEREKNKQGYIVYRNVLATYRDDYIRMFHVDNVLKVEVSQI